MVVGTLRFVIQIPGAGSLKAKRQVLRRIVERIRARFNVAVAEVGDNDLWQKATVGVAAVGNDRAFVNEVLDKVLGSVDAGSADAHVVSHELELITLSDMYGGGSGLSAERTLAEAEASPERHAPDLDTDGLPSLEELEAAGEAYRDAPAPSQGPRSGRRRK